MGVALLRAGRVLAARRTAPAAAAGGWEFPGGKVEPGESEAEAARREVVEELGCEVVVGHRLDGEVPVGAFVLRVHVGEIVAGEPVATEHDQLMWLGPEELDAVPWLPADRPFLPQVADLLRRRPDGDDPVEAHFDEGEDAEAVLATLHGEGYEAYLGREGFAGEDDSEDRAWLVRVEDAAAAERLEALVAEVDLAWIVDPVVAPAVPPPPLPSGPKRLKRE